MKKYIPAVLAFVFLFSFSALVVHAQVCTGNSDCATNKVCYFDDVEASTGECVDRVNDTTRGGTNDTTSGGGSKITTKIQNPLAGVGVHSIQDLLKVILNNIIIPIGGVVAVLAFIYSGFLYVMARGDENAIKKAHTTLLYTAIGTAVLLGSAVIASVLTNTVNQLK
jgi:hypothetical protein